MTFPPSEMDTFLSSSSTSIPSPIKQILTRISTHQRERKASDDEAARKLKDKMIVEYRNQSEQHEKLTTEFVGRVQDGLGALVANLLMQTATSPEESRRIYQEMINNYILGHLNIYQKAVKKQKLNSRQRTDRFSGKSLTRYKETLEKDESDLLDLFRQLEKTYQKTCSAQNISTLSTPESMTLRSDSLAVKFEDDMDAHKRNENSRGNTCHDFDVEMDGFCLTSSHTTALSARREKKRKIQRIEGS